MGSYPPLVIHVCMYCIVCNFFYSGRTEREIASVGIRLDQPEVNRFYNQRQSVETAPQTNTIQEKNNGWIGNTDQSTYVPCTYTCY